MSSPTSRDSFNKAHRSTDVFEASVEYIDHLAGTCTIRPINTGTNCYYNDVPIPNMAGLGNAGIFLPIYIGSRVTAHYTNQGRESVVITQDRGREALYPNNFNNVRYKNVPAGVTPYPMEGVADNDSIIQGHSAQSLNLGGDGSARLLSSSGFGLDIQKDGINHASVMSSEDYDEYTRGSRFISGSVRRISAKARAKKPNVDASTSRLFAEKDYYKKAENIGFFHGSPALKQNQNGRRRNPAISEYRLVINEFATDYMFTGFDDEVGRINNEKKIYDKLDTYNRNRERGNNLHLAEHELIEIIGGNVVDINGNILDVNYGKLFYGDKNNTVPGDDIKLKVEHAKKISRRGIGYHFQLSTNTSSHDSSNSNSNFVFDVDKEGAIKAHFPRSSNTGNIMFPNNVEYISANNSAIVTPSSNVPSIEGIPITLRDENGKVIFPIIGSTAQRATGIRYQNDTKSPYFPINSENEYVRVNPTRYHNMYSSCERLFANMITNINILREWRDDSAPSSPVGKPFEIPGPSENEGTITGIPKNRVSVTVVRQAPAINTGGETIVCGKLISQDEKALTNSFELSEASGTVKTEVAGEEVGGKSLQLDFDGSIETSIGKDNVDGKSILLDTDGSVVAWLGKDKQGRSLALQTDGSVAINLGGGYSGEKMSVGRLDIRVNVTDNGLVMSEGSGIKAESDFIISISDKGLVIAGCRKDLPMVFRNDGAIFIESTSDKVVIKGTEVNTIDFGGTMTTSGSTGNSGGA